MRKILLVDDDKLVLKSLRLLLKMVLSGRGIALVEAYGYSDALLKLRRNNIDAIITDVHLGDGYGEDLHLEFPKIPIVYTTGDHGWTPVKGAPRLYKPYMLKDLEEVLSCVLKIKFDESLAEMVGQISSSLLSVDAAIISLLTERSNNET